MTLVSVIIPAHNEDRTIIHLLEKVAAQKIHGINFEIVVIDDGSTDETPNLLKSHSNLYTKLLEHPQNRGKGAAVQTGLQAASGDFILFQDADLEYDPDDYDLLLAPVRSKNADVVMGSRIGASPITRVHYFWHKFGNQLITLFFNIVNNTTFTDVYSCYLLYRRSLVDPNRLVTRGWEQHAEILSKAVNEGQVFFEVPISYYGRTYDEGKKIRAHHILSVFWAIFRFRFFR